MEIRFGVEWDPERIPFPAPRKRTPCRFVEILRALLCEVVFFAPFPECTLLFFEQSFRSGIRVTEQVQEFGRYEGFPQYFSADPVKDSLDIAAKYCIYI